MTLSRVENDLLSPTGLSEQEVADTLAVIASRQIDYADIYFQSSWHESMVLEDSIIKDGSFNIDRGLVFVPYPAKRPVLHTQIR